MDDLAEQRLYQNKVQEMVNKGMSSTDPETRKRAEELLKLLIGEDNSGGGSCGDRSVKT